MITTKILDHAYIIIAVILAAYSQLVIRWQVELAGELPTDLSGKFGFIVQLLLNSWVISSIMATFLAGVLWMLAMTKFEISYAFPFVSLNYIILLVAGHLLFGEAINASKVAGTILVMMGLLVIVRG